MELQCDQFLERRASFIAGQVEFVVATRTDPVVSVYTFPYHPLH